MKLFGVVMIEMLKGRQIFKSKVSLLYPRKHPKTSNQGFQGSAKGCTKTWAVEETQVVQELANPISCMYIRSYGDWYSMTPHQGGGPELKGEDSFISQAYQMCLPILQPHFSIA